MREIFLIIHFIGLAMGLGTSIGFIFLGKSAASLPPSERGKFMLTVMGLRRMGQIGLALLILSGGALMTPYWKTLAVHTTLIIKLSLVLVLTIFIIYTDRLAAKADPENPLPVLMKMKSLGPIGLLIVLSIITLAVLTFH